MKILIIDDSPDALAVAKARLVKEQLELVCADGGVAGIDAAQEVLVDPEAGLHFRPARP